MKNFKLVDFGVQILIILICIIAIVMDQIDFYRAYFIAGGSQLLSMLLHECLRYFTTKGTQRRVYHNICYILCGCMLLTPLVYVTGGCVYTAAFRCTVNGALITYTSVIKKHLCT